MKKENTKTARETFKTEFDKFLDVDKMTDNDIIDYLLDHGNMLWDENTKMWNKLLELSYISKFKTNTYEEIYDNLSNFFKTYEFTEDGKYLEAMIKQIHQSKKSS